MLLRNPYRMRSGMEGVMMGGMAPLYQLRLTDLELMVSRRVEEEVGRLAYDHTQQLAEVRQDVWDEGATAALEEARQIGWATLDSLKREINSIIAGLNLKEPDEERVQKHLTNAAQACLARLNREVELG